MNDINSNLFWVFFGGGELPQMLVIYTFIYVFVHVWVADSLKKLAIS